MTCRPNRKTVHGYEQILDRHVHAALGDLMVREVHQGHIAALLTEKLVANPPFAVGTVRYIYATIRRLLSRAKF